MPDPGKKGGDVWGDIGVNTLGEPFYLKKRDDDEDDVANDERGEWNEDDEEAAVSVAPCAGEQGKDDCRDSLPTVEKTTLENGEIRDIQTE